MPEEHCVERSIRSRGTKSVCRIVVITLPCQGRDEGSIPFTRSKSKNRDKKNWALMPNFSC